MKRVLFTLLSYCFVLVGWAQTPAFDFRATDVYGNNCLYKIIDPVNKYVELWGADESVPYPYILSTWGSTKKVTLPATIQYNGNTYTVKRLEKFIRANPHPLADTLVISEGIEEIGIQALIWSAGAVTYLPTTLKKMEGYAFGECWSLKELIGLENTQVDKLEMAFNQCSSVTTHWKLPRTLKHLGSGTLSMPPSQHELVLPEGLERIDYRFIDASGTLGHAPGLNNFSPTDFLKVVRSLNPVPPTVENYSASEQDIMLFTIITKYDYMTGVRTYSTPDSLYIPIDATAAYDVAQGWSKYKGKYYEQVKIGASGYATLYLATENFEVPTGYEAFVIENITKATTPGGLDKANAKKFVAGSIIPAGQAVILKGAANQTCVYQANVSGTPVTITDNMLIGTATDQTINATGYDYYLFGNGDLGQGFYRQTGHDKSSISLKAHKAGLRVPKGGGGSAKAFVIDFDAADTYVPTGIQSVKTPQPQSDVIYDLQGRRVTHPTRGIYIMNGKKMVFN